MIYYLTSTTVPTWKKIFYLESEEDLPLYLDYMSFRTFRDLIPTYIDLG